MDHIRRAVRAVIPKPIFSFLQPYYHYLLAFLGAVVYRFPSREITIIGVTGTKGKSTTTEILGHILRSSGHKAATLSTIQFSIGDNTERNLHKMTMPGRFFVQKFLRQAVGAGCTHAVVEMTSEGAKQHRHRFIEIDGLIFTNLTPEHIESHGSFEKYKDAKLSLARAVALSSKRPRYLVANIDDDHGQDFLNFRVEKILPYSLKDLTLHSLQKDSISLVINDVTIRVPLVGLFNVYNVLAAITLAKEFGIELTQMRDALKDLPTVAGRVEQFESPEGAGKHITAVVDYAHTPDSLTKLYEAFPNRTKVCVLGNTGGGRDTWKRPEMATIAETHCEQIILTNEDPYDENPQKIVDDMLKGISDQSKVQVIMDRRKAIETAITIAPPDSVVLVSGKGTDPYIMGPHGTKEEWSDAEVVRDALQKLPTELESQLL